MRGFIQLLLHCLLAGAAVTGGWSMFPDLHWAPKTAAVSLFLIFYCYLAAALWIHSWGKRDWIDRVGLLVNGLGFACLAAVFLVPIRPWAPVLWLVGIVVMIFGRALWELLVLRGKT